MTTVDGRGTKHPTVFMHNNDTHTVYIRAGVGTLELTFNPYDVLIEFHYENANSEDTTVDMTMSYKDIVDMIKEDKR